MKRLINKYSCQLVAEEGNTNENLRAVNKTAYFYGGNMFHRAKQKKKAPKNTESKVQSINDDILLALLVSLSEDQKLAIIEFIKSFK